MTDKPCVVIAMSGGVDSSVAAALLVQQGYQVIGMMLRLWSELGSEAENRCCSPDAMVMARRVASRLNVPFYAIDARDIFRRTVVEAFLEGYKNNLTPNPCVVCNRVVRWDFLLNQALSIGATYMATGHYARIIRGPNKPVEIFRGIDPVKDQSYVLHTLTQSQLQRTMFPLGEFTKPEVRQLARSFNLPVSERQDSQDLCFLGRGDYRSFLQRHVPEVNSPGPIINLWGDILGQHQGLSFFTIGQRKGLGISSPVPYYVIKKDNTQNALVVGVLEELGEYELVAAKVNWISAMPPTTPFRAMVKIRYTAQAVWCSITPLPDGDVRIIFDTKMRDITPGQAAVIYEDQKLLGGGIIQP
jgi:tRNA-specific 2-thiouridylase